MIIKSLRKTCTACPSQWEGELVDGRHIYIRYRHGWGRIGIGGTIEDAVKAGWSDAPPDAFVAIEWESDDEMDGYLTDDDMLVKLEEAGIELMKGAYEREQGTEAPWF